MSAEALGTNLLREVKVEGLDELLRTLRSNNLRQENQIYTNVPAIDKILNIFTSAQNHPNNQHQHPVLELVGSSPCSGKTQLLYHIITRLLLPPSYNNIPLAGKSTAIILFDLRSNFSLLRLRDIITHYIHSCLPQDVPPLEKEPSIALIRDSLLHLHIFRPQSSASFLSTLQNVEKYILDIRAHISANRTVGAVIISGIDAFIHQDRLEDVDGGHQHSPPSFTKTPSSIPYSHQRFRDIIAHLRNLQHTFSTPIIATSSALSSLSYHRLSNGQQVPILPSHLPPPWRNYVTVRLICERERVRKFQYGVSVLEVQGREAAMRQEAVEKGRFV
ncbi:MAG: hypothetical protein Q9204_009080, partial [Flavoplaca sp. TL-2023a]